MSRYKFSPAERLGVFTAHDGICYLCRKPIDYASMEVDHVVPEQLLDNPEELARVLAVLGCKATFDVNSYENWLPACRPCNGRKSGTPFDAAPIIVVELQKAAKKVEVAKRVAERAISDRKVAQAIAVVEVAATRDELPLDKLMPLFNVYLDAHPEAIAALIKERDSRTRTLPPGHMGFLVRPEPMLELRLTPFAKVLYRSDMLEIASTPYGVGYRPTDPAPDASFYCGHCGSLGPWSGARCLSCGYLSEND